MTDLPAHTTIETDRLRLVPFALAYAPALNAMNNEPAVMEFLSDGTPETMDTRVIDAMAGAKLIPVIAPIGSGPNGETLNVNGDTAAGAIAAALKADRLLLLTDVAGVKDAQGNVLTELTPDTIRSLTAEGVIAGGMIPKTETALAAIDGGVRAVVILDGRAPNACLLELYTEHGAGSLIRHAR